MNVNNNRQMTNTAIEIEFGSDIQAIVAKNNDFELAYEPKTALNESFTNGSASPP